MQHNQNYFDKLPLELKFKVFEYLPVRDVVHLLMANKKNNDINTAPIFWQHMLKKDFQYHVSEKKETKSKSLYTKFSKALHIEEELTVAYFSAMSAILQVGLLNPGLSYVTMQDAKVVHEKLMTSAHDDYINFCQSLVIKYKENYQVEDKRAFVRQMYRDLVLADEKTVLLQVTQLLSQVDISTVKNIEQADLSDTAHLRHYLIMAMMTVNATASLNLLLKKLNVDVRQKLLKKHGTLWLSRAAEFMQIEIVKRLLKAGVDVNQQVYSRTLRQKDIYYTPLSFALMPLQRLAVINDQRALDKVADVIHLLIEHKANPDAPGRSETAQDNIRLIHTTLGFSAIVRAHQLFDQINAHDDVSEHTNRAVNDVLSIIFDASMLEQQVHNQPALR